MALRIGASHPRLHGVSPEDERPGESSAGRGTRGEACCFAEFFLGWNCDCTGRVVFCFALARHSIFDHLPISKPFEKCQLLAFKVGFADSKERFNVWVAYMNLECTFGSDETSDAIFRRAASHNEAKQA